MSMIYFRIKQEETIGYRRSKSILEDNGINDILTLKNKLYIMVRYYWKETLATSLNWCLFDIVFYAQGIFSNSVLEALGNSDNSNSSVELLIISLKNVFLTLGGLPGYYISVALIPYFGCKIIQLQGFIFMGIVCFIMGIGWNYFKENGGIFVFLYGLLFLFANFGPNSTTFVLPVKVFPTALRSTGHGIAAAFGKFGATIGVFSFGALVDVYGNPTVFILCACVCIIGAIVTIILTDNGPKDAYTLDDKFLEYITNNEYIRKLPGLGLKPSINNSDIIIKDHSLSDSNNN